MKLLRAKTLRDLGATDGQLQAMEAEIERAARNRPDVRQAGLLGIVPMFVGLAYLIFFGIEEWRVRSVPPPQRS